jgi:hypothetical protein
VREVMDVIRAVFEGMYATGANHGGIPGPLASAESMLAFAREHPLALRWMQQPFVADGGTVRLGTPVESASSWRPMR